MKKNWLKEKDLKKLDRKTWEKTGARPKTNTFIAKSSSSGTKNHWYQPLKKTANMISSSISKYSK